MRKQEKVARLTRASMYRKTVRGTVLLATAVFGGAPLGCAGHARSLEQEEQAMGEYFAIRELLDRASDAMNHHDWAVIGSLMAEDVVWERLPPHPWTLEGRGALQSFLTQNDDTLDLLSYNISATAIHLEDAEHASARSMLSETLRFKKTGAIIRFVGTYQDQLAKRNGRWVFTRRTFRARYEEDVTAPTRVFDGAASPPSALDASREQMGQERP